MLYASGRGMDSQGILVDEVLVEIDDVMFGCSIGDLYPSPSASTPCTIFKVPEHIRKLDREAYEPVVSPIGPFHSPSHSSAMQHYKRSCVKHLLSRHRNQEHDSQLEEKCLLEVRKRIDEVRNCYSQQLKFDDGHLATIMWLDGCLIIYLMLNLYWRNKKSSEVQKEEKEFESPSMAGLFTVNLVLLDLLKLENQVPFFIIQLLFDHLKTSKESNLDLVDLALHLFEDIHPKQSTPLEKKSSVEYHHLLHLFHSSRIPSPIPNPGKSTSALGRIAPPDWIPNATELDRAGVKFKKKKEPGNFLNITFEQRKMEFTPLLCLLKLYLMFRSGRMEIPKLRIYDYTGPLFQNLIAFEQCYRTEMHITIYALFMDSIIDQAEDVRLLHLEGILKHKLSSDQEVAALFNNLGKQIHFTLEKNYLADEIDKINNFYKSKWHKWLAGLRRDYLGNPWAIISVLAAIFLLLLTVEQGAFSALSYFHSS